MLVLSNDELMVAIEYAVVICRQTCDTTKHHNTMQAHLLALTAEQNRRAMEREQSSTHADAGAAPTEDSPTFIGESSGPASAGPEAV